MSLRHNLDLSNTFNIAVFAITCIAFWCCCRWFPTLSFCFVYLCHARLGELVIDSFFDGISHILQSTLIRHGIATNGLKLMNFHLPCMKMRERGEDVNVTDTTCLCSPTTAFKHHPNNAIPGSAPLFTFEPGDGWWVPMRQAWFLKWYNSIWEWTHGS